MNPREKRGPASSAGIRAGNGPERHALRVGGPPSRDRRAWVPGRWPSGCVVRRRPVTGPRHCLPLRGQHRLACRVQRNSLPVSRLTACEDTTCGTEAL